MIVGKCEVCGDPVNDKLSVPAYPVTGWETGRSGGGANRILKRERIPNRVAHELCVKHGAPVGQGRLA